MPTLLDTDSSDDFSGSFNDLTDLPTNLDTNATDDFSGSYNDLTDLPVNLDTDATDDFSGSFMDLTNVPADLADGDDGIGRLGTGINSVISGGYSNSASAYYSSIGGGYSNSASGQISTIGGGSSNIAYGVAATVGGGSNNEASGYRSTIAGGYSNEATGTVSAIGGGYFNTASGHTSTISGGYDNSASAGSSVGGGSHNAATGSNSTIAGGSSNTASSYYSTVAGGRQNSASGDGSTIGGGRLNIASGYYSTIVGGKGVKAQSFGEVALGLDNSYATNPDATSFVATDRILSVGNGTGGTRSNALTILKNGNTTLHGLLTIDADNVGGSIGFTLPGQDGTAGQVLSTDGSGSVGWQTPSSFSGSFYDLTNVPFGLEDGGGIGKYGTGNYSTISGGKSNSSTHRYSTVGGGVNNTASGRSATVSGGDLNVASGAYSHVVGRENTASNKSSSVSGGGRNVASGQYSNVAGGFLNYATGKFSGVGAGWSAFAQSYGEFVIGLNSLNATSPTAESFIATDRIFTVGNGLSDLYRSNALVILKNGNTDINGALVANSLGVDGKFTLPTADGTSGQVLSTDGSGVVSWATPASAFSGSFQDLTNVPAGLSDGDDGIARAGSGTNSTIGGGMYNFASGTYSTAAGGYDNTASASNATISGGSSNDVTQYGGTISGGISNTVSSEKGVIGGGQYNTASGFGSSIGGGSNNTTSGNLATIPGGNNLKARSFGEVAVGVFNTDTATVNSSFAFNGSDQLFVIGNGTADGSRSDALRMLKNGNTTLNGNLQVNGDLAYSGSLSNSSDKRLKKDITELSNVLQTLLKLEGYKYRYNGIKATDTLSTHIGVIAQELQQVYPELVKTGDDGYLSVNYMEMIPLLLEGIKELSMENTTLKTQNESLEERQEQDDQKFAAMEAKLDQLLKLMVPSEDAVGKN